MENSQSNRLLSSALTANAVFSTLTGLASIFFSGALVQLFGVDVPFPVLGIGLLLFAGYVFYLSRSQPVPVARIREVVIADLLWVGGSIILLIAGLGISVVGKWIIGIVAVFVADFALFQYLGLRRLTN